MISNQIKDHKVILNRDLNSLISNHRLHNIAIIIVANEDIIKKVSLCPSTSSRLFVNLTSLYLDAILSIIIFQQRSIGP